VEEGNRQRGGRLRRLREELDEEGLALDWSPEVLAELDYALRPKIHERRIPSFGAIVAPSTDANHWGPATSLGITRRPAGELPLDKARRFADGLSTWVVPSEAGAELLVFDRPAGSERDLVVLAEAMGATLVQRHPSGVARLVGSFGVLRWDGIGWHHEPPVSTWIDAVGACSEHGSRHVLAELLEFAVHDLGARGVGALLIYRPDDDAPAPAYDMRLPAPPLLRINEAYDLAPLRHVLAQVDGAAVFDRDGGLRHLGVRLVPSTEAEADVDGYRGMRHTAGRRYSYDDPAATVIVVSEDGPVTVLRKGELMGRSAPT
jgi:hypothetical protein